MFEARLKAALVGLLLVFLVLAARLVDLQVVRASYFREETRRSLLRRPRLLPASRGRILARTGEVLVQDEPSWDIVVDYDVIAAETGEDRDALAALARQVRLLKRARRYPQAQTDQEIARQFIDEVQNAWRDIADCSGGRMQEAADVRAEAKAIYDHIAEIRRIVADRRGFDSPVAEEQVGHAVVTGLDRDIQITARERLAGYPWVSVDASTHRAYAPHAEPFAHLLGRLGRVDAKVIEGDPNPDDPFSRYLPNDRLGISGVEAAAESTLRGRRGQIVSDREGNSVGDPIQAENGRDVTLTIHPDLQRTLFQLLGDRVRTIPESSGGAIVVLDVATRELLALVSYPSYDPTAFDELFPVLREDTEHAPLSFRAVANRYAPGSIVKPLVCLAGLANGKIALDTRENCVGYLLPDNPDRWRCWEIRGTSIRMAHGFVDVVAALTGSCNVFMYRLGERLGVDGLCSAFDMAGIGVPSGISLREESYGINPTPDWLMRERSTGVHPAHARNFAIGQGELSVTPVQAANLAATYASGRFRQVTLIRGASDGPEWTLPGSASHWAAIHQAIYSVVNDPEGTAFKYAHFEHDGYALCGKTGSATAHSWPTAFRIPHVDSFGASGVATIRAGAKGPACRRFEDEFPGATYDPSDVTVAATWPRNATPESEYSHAWFAGYLQSIDDQQKPIWSETPRVAFAILVEFGGSGGHTSGPIARDVATVLLDVLGNDLRNEP